MKRRLFTPTVLVVLAVSAAASAHSGGYGVAIHGVTVNRDHSVTLTWSLEHVNVFNSSIAVDAHVVRSGSDRARRFTTRPLSGGWHTITIEVREIFETYTPSGSYCVVSGGHWMCTRIWRSSMRVGVPYETYCVVPLVTGLQLDVATERIRDASCSMGAVTRIHSKRQAGTVLTQRPKKTRRQLPNGTAISVLVSSGHP